MPGRDTAPNNGRELENQVAELAEKLQLRVRHQVAVARRIWGARRLIDLVLTEPVTRKTLGIECKFQATAGTAEEKLPATVQDIAAWPIPGLVVFSGEGFTENMRAFLHSTGKAVELEDLEPWLRLFFGLDEA
ncbi:MAG: PD-(D/E)XK nuclease superfamily protein [Roseimicrobium sp.]